jgi:flagellar L-ring protein FlgH
MNHSVQSICLMVVAGLISAGCPSSRTRVNDPTELHSYTEAAHAMNAKSDAGEGSLWVSQGSRSNLFRDPKARFVNDMVTILVSESTQAVATADASNSRNSSVSAGIDNLMGLETKIKELPTMASGKSDSSFQGKGSTSRATTLETSITARVIDVLPNGYLVVEGMRELRVNNENQSVFLTGVVRPEDVSSGNNVISSKVAQMSVRVQGRGVVSQPLKPGWLYKILMGILPF